MQTLSLANKHCSETKEKSCLLISALFLVMLLLVGLSYHFFDRAIVLYVEQQGFSKHLFFQALPYIPNFIIYGAAIFLLSLMAKGKTVAQINTQQKTLLALLLGASSSVAMASFLKILFGRSSPIYWLEHLEQTHNYGFHLLRGWNQAFQDFPSGHSAAIFAITTVMFAAKKFRLTAAITAIATIIGLISIHSHFLSDCIGGAFLGFMIGLLSSRYFELRAK